MSRPRLPLFDSGNPELGDEVSREFGEGRLKCIDSRKGDCAGEVRLRPSLTGTGMPIPRCDHHWELRLEWQEEHERIYPDSPIPPAWFDPEAAGERWDDDY